MSVMLLFSPEGIVNTEGEAVKYLDFLTEEEYLDILDSQPELDQYLSEDGRGLLLKWVVKQFMIS